MTDMTMRDKLAAIIDKNLPEDYDFGVEAADAIIAALPGMVHDLVWDETKWPLESDLFGYVIDKRNENSFFVYHPHNRPQWRSTLEAAKAAANAHNRLAFCKMIGL